MSRLNRAVGVGLLGARFAGLIGISPKNGAGAPEGGRAATDDRRDEKIARSVVFFKHRRKLSHRLVSVGSNRVKFKRLEGEPLFPLGVDGKSFWKSLFTSDFRWEFRRFFTGNSQFFFECGRDRNFAFLHGVGASFACVFLEIKIPMKVPMIKPRMLKANERRTQNPWMDGGFAEIIQ